METTTRHQTITYLALAATLLVTFGSAALAQPGRGGDQVRFEVQSVDRETWVVTARDLASGETFSFRLPPEAFRGQKFEADLAQATVGRKISVQAPPGVRMRQAVVERPVGAVGGGLESPPGRRARPYRDRPSGGPGSPGGSDRPEHPSDYVRSQGPGGGSASKDWEVLSVDPRSWVAQVRGSDGAIVSLEVDPQAFVGYRFSASVRDLRAGEGFELLASNEQPLSNCCTVRGRSER